MATSVISGRVDEAIRRRADAAIRAANLSVGDVIRNVWEHIARTGEVPSEALAPQQADAMTEREEQFARFEQLRASFAGEQWLAELTDERMREELGKRHV